MSGDAEIEQLRAAVSCPVLLERKGYKLDERESSRNNPKYRRGAGEIIIVNHNGQGWWDPGSSAKGDVFKLAQHLDPSLNFGQVRRELRQMVGMAPTYAPADRPSSARKPHLPPALQWTGRKVVTQGSPVWTYLVQERGLTPEVVAAAARADVLREGPYGTAWFAHRDGAGALTGVEMRGPNYRGFSSDGNKSLFRLQLGQEAPTRLAVLEAPIKAMAFAALEGMRTDTLYVATAGGMGPLTLTSLQEEMAALSGRPNATVVAAGDADAAGERYAVRVQDLAAEAGLPTQRAAPSGHKDWDDVLKTRGVSGGMTAGPARSAGLATVLRTLQPPAPSHPLPWSPAPVAMGARVRAFEERHALRAAAAMAGPEARPQAEPAPQRPTPSMGVS